MKNDQGVTIMAAKHRRYNADRAWKGRSYRLGGARIKQARDKAAVRADRVSG